jgi:hypothetical protein
MVVLEGRSVLERKWKQVEVVNMWTCAMMVPKSDAAHRKRKMQ